MKREVTGVWHEFHRLKYLAQLLLLTLLNLQARYRHIEHTALILALGIDNQKFVQNLYVVWTKR
jgi:hypothetical protein